jgi:hypothetical protein
VFARITIITINAYVEISLVLFLVYNNWLLYQVKKDYKTKSNDGNNIESSAYQEVSS